MIPRRGRRASAVGPVSAIADADATDDSPFYFAIDESSVPPDGVEKVPAPDMSPSSGGTETAGRYDAVICGGGPAGLLSAIMLAQQEPFSSPGDGDIDGDGARIAVFDRLPAPPSPTDADAWSDVARFYLVGLGHRGQRALERFGALDDVRAASVPIYGRMDWAPGGPPEGTERLAADKKVTTLVLPRDKLVGVLQRHISERYGDRIVVHHEREVTPLSLGDGEDYSVALSVSRCVAGGIRTGDGPPEAAECDVDTDADAVVVRTNLLLGADGAARTIANEMESIDAEMGARNPFRVTRYEDDNRRVYKTVPVQMPEGWRHDLNYSARSGGSRITFEALPSDSGGMYCALLLMYEGDDLAGPGVDPGLLRKFFDEEFPQFSPLVGDEELARTAAKPSSGLPTFRYAGPRICHGTRTALLGDCIHTVKPYYGLGANSALEDVELLCDSINEAGKASVVGDGNGGKETSRSAVEIFSDRRAEDSRHLVQISRGMDRPGKIGTARFLVPLIADSLFHKLAPKIFGPNMFAMFQKTDITFRQIRRKKRIDRAMQMACVGTLTTAAALTARKFVAVIAKATGMSGSRVTGCLLAAVAGVQLIRKVQSSLTEKVWTRQ